MLFLDRKRCRLTLSCMLNRGKQIHPSILSFVFIFFSIFRPDATRAGERTVRIREVRGFDPLQVHRNITGGASEPRHRPPPQRRSIPFKSTASSRTAYRSRRLFYASQIKVISHSFRRSFFQKQSRTAAPCLVDNFGIPLCWALFLFSPSPLPPAQFSVCPPASTVL